MSFSLDLDEYSDKQLIDELERRMKLLVQKKCSYCSRFFTTCSCKLQKQADRERSANGLYMSLQRVSVVYAMSQVNRGYTGPNDDKGSVIYGVPGVIGPNGCYPDPSELDQGGEDAQGNKIE